MGVIVDIKASMKSPDILSVLAESIYMPTEERLMDIANEYINNVNILVYGYKTDHIICGLIVLDVTKKEEVIILNIAVERSYQNSGIGRKLIEYALNNIKASILVAETDGEAVDFYRKCGFVIDNLGEKYPNTIRYECKYVY